MNKHKISKKPEQNPPTTKLREPRESTIRKLFALSSNQCAFPDCPTNIVDHLTGTILGEICHICAQREGGPRFDPGQTSIERHSLKNLILMCGVHHKIIDADENAATYTVDRLLEIKAAHEAKAQTHEAPASIPAEAIAALLEKIRSASQNVTHMDFRGAFFNAGGFGGAPGGAGGAGGVIHIVGITPSGFREEVTLDGKHGEFPGGGAGGGGAMIFSGRLASPEDLQDGLRVNAFFFANSAEIRDELLFSLAGGWEKLPIDSLPKDVDIKAIAIIETGSIMPSTLLALAITIQDPAGNPVASESFDISVSERMRPIMRQCQIINLRFRASQPGVWLFSLRSGDTELARAPLNIFLIERPK